MGKVLWQRKLGDNEVRVVESKDGELVSWSIEKLYGLALMGEPIWHEVHPTDSIHRPLAFAILKELLEVKNGPTPQP